MTSSRNLVGFYVVAFGLLCVFLTNIENANASPFRMFGYDTSAIAGANSDIAYGDSYGVLYSNPAILPRFPEYTGVEFILYKPSMKVNLIDRPANADISMAIYNTTPTSSKLSNYADRPVATTELVNQRDDTNINGTKVYMGAGFSHSFGLPDFRIAGMMVLPLVDVMSTNSWYPDEREQTFSNQVHFSRFGEWDTILGGMLGAAYAPSRYFSMGLGLQVTASMVANLNIYIPDANVQNYMQTNASISARPKFRPVIGVQSEPTDWMSLGLTFRMESYIEADSTGVLDMWDLHHSINDVGKATVVKHVVTKIKMIIDYEPMELTGGVGFKYAGWKMNAGVTWNRWSNYIDPHGEKPEDSAVPDVTDEATAAPFPSGDDYKWLDTISANVGTSYRFAKWSEIKAGFSYYPTPVPAQTGRTSYADSDTWCIALGNRFDIKLGEDYKFFAVIGLQFWLMNSTVVYKDTDKIRDEFPDDLITLDTRESISAAKGLQTNNPGFPGYKNKGWLLVTSASLNYEF